MANSLHFSMLTVFAIVMALTILLPKLFERFNLPGVLGFILCGPGLTHLLAHPILTKLGLLQNEAVVVTVGGTILTERFGKQIVAATPDPDAPLPLPEPAST